MRAVEKHIEEMNRLTKSIKNTKSQHLKNDYSKNLHRMKKELKEYCGYRGYNYLKILKDINKEGD